MDNNRLDQLMDEGWQKLKISLDAELPQKKEKKYFFFWLIFSGLLFTVLGFYFFKNHHTAIFEKPITNPKDTSNFITSHSDQTQLYAWNKIVNIEEQKTKDNVARDSELDKSQNISEINNEEVSILKTTKPIKEADELRKKSTRVSSELNADGNKNEIVLTNKQDKNANSSKHKKNDSEVRFVPISSHTDSKIAEVNKVEPLNYTMSLPFSFKFPLISMTRNQYIEGIKPEQNIKSSLFSFGIKATTAFTAFDLPTNYKVGIYGRKSLSKRWFSELSVSFQKYNQYQIIHHNGQNFSNILYQDIQLQSGAPSGRALNSVYISNNKNLTINQLGIIDESILSSSLNSMDLINAEVGAGYRFKNRLSIFLSLNLAKRINTSSEINNTNTTLFNNFNNRPIDQSNLKLGDQLLRKWIYGGAGGLEYKLSEKMALRSQIHIVPTLHSSQLINKESLDKNASSSLNFDIKSTLPDTQMLQKGIMSIELGFLWRLE